jgi:NAD(P)-dependent dehydrogenase (short-subunit alcohol dehydrogenase family)
MIGSCAVITGASRGLGAAIAKRLWDQQWNLVLIAKNYEALKNFAQHLAHSNSQSIKLMASDLSSAEQVKSLVVELQKLDRVDVLVNNAAIHGSIGPLVSVSMQNWADVIQVNLLSPVAICQGLLPQLMKAPMGGSIINISGGGATGPRPNFSAYATAKAGLVRFSETLAQEVKDTSLSINCISPGPMNTDLLKEVIATGEGIVGNKEIDMAMNVVNNQNNSIEATLDLINYLIGKDGKGISGKLISSLWDRWEKWGEQKEELMKSDAYTLRRIIGKERGLEWGDK